MKSGDNQRGIGETVPKGDRKAFPATGEIESKIVRHDFKGKVRGKRTTGTVHPSGGVREVVVSWEA